MDIMQAIKDIVIKAIPDGGYQAYPQTKKAASALPKDLIKILAVDDLEFALDLFREQDLSFGFTR